MDRKSGPHTLNRLSALAVQKLKVPGKHADGGGLYLLIAPSGSKSWVFRYMIAGRSREMGLGPLHAVPVDQARELAKQARTTLKSGQDPLVLRDSAEKIARDRLAKEGKTFAWCAATYVADVRGPELSNPKHRAQWLSTLEAYAYPTFGKVIIGDVTMQMVLDALQPIWLTKNETASRVRQRMEAVFSWAKVQGYRQGDNPAAWKGALDHLLPNPKKVKNAKHYPSLPFDQVASFMRALSAHHGSSARALEWLILSANRTNAVILAEWNEIDRERLIWTSPAEKMKGDHDHRCPITKQMLSVLDMQESVKDGTYIFHNKGKPLSNAAMLMLVGGMHTQATPWVDPKEDNKRITPHGFRSTFRDWAGDMTDFPEEICELALAHSTGTKTEAAYRRADALEKRRPLMQAWANYCAPEKDPAEAG